VRNPNHTWCGLWKLSLKLDDITRPPTKTAETRYHKRGVYILKESSNTSANRYPAPTEWSEIFQRKFMSVTIRETKAAAKIHDLRKTGKGNRKII
jgi:hypothetical protein